MKRDEEELAGFEDEVDGGSGKTHIFF